MNKRVLIGLLSLGAVLSTAAACAHPSDLAGDVTPDRGIGVTARNDNFLDVDVYVVASGMPRRLGTVTGNSGGTFTLDPSYTSRDFRLVATPIGGFGRASSGSLFVSAGERVQFTVGSFLANGSVFVQ